MIKRATLLLFSLTLLLSVSEVWAQSYALWPNAPGLNATPTVSGNVSAQAMTWTSNLVPNSAYSSSGTNTKTAGSYMGMMMSAGSWTVTSSTAGTATASVTMNGGTWASASESSKYEEYIMAPAAGYSLNTISMSMYLGCSNSAGKLKAQIAYSTDGSNFTMIGYNPANTITATSGTTAYFSGSAIVLGNATQAMQTTNTGTATTLGYWSSSLPTSIAVPAGGSLYLRVYPFAGATSATYGFAVANVKLMASAQLAGSAPVVTSDSISSIAALTATAYGTITNIGSPAITVSGFCWSTSASPTISDSHTTDGGTALGAITGSLTNLSPATTYHVRAYATYTYGTVYGADVSFTTLSSTPVVTTASISNIGLATATAGGNVTATGGSSVTARGVCWSLSANPTISGSHTTDGSGTGVFTSSITGLASSTTYHVRAYATNSVGTGYGPDSTFTTLAAAAMPTVTTSTVSSITYNSASGGGNVTADGGATVTARGVCWSTSASPTIGDSHTSDGTATGAFTSSITGLTQGTLYHVRAYATNSVGTSYGGDSTFTTAIITSYYNKASSDISQLSNWGANTDGSGIIPISFTANGITYNVANASPSIASDLTIGGTNSLFVVGGSTALALNIPSGVKLTLSATDSLSIAASCSLTVAGTVLNKSTKAVKVTGNLAVSNGGTYDFGATAGTIPTATWSTGSTVRVSGVVGTSGSDFTGLQGVNQTFYNFTIDDSVLVGKLIVAYNGGSFATTGAFTVNNANTGMVQITRSSTQNSVSVGSYVQNQGDVCIINNASSTGNRTLTVGGNFTLNNASKFTVCNAQSSANTTLFGILSVAGNITVAPTAVLKKDQYGVGTVVFNGSSAQTIQSGLRSSYKLGYTINNAAGVSLLNDLIVNDTLKLTSGALTLGTHNLILDTTAVIGGSPSASSMVIATGTGEVRKTITATPTTISFPLGSGSLYAPISVTLSSGSLASAYIGAQAVGTKSSHNTSATDYLNRTWNLTANGITSPVYNVTATYADGDLAGTEANIFGGLYTGSAWSALGAVDAASNSFTGSSLTSFGEITGGSFGAGKVTVKVIPQGFYNSGVLNQSDTVKILLANTTTPYAVVDSAFAILDSVSFTATGTFSAAASGSYYIVIKHRSSVETWSASGVAFTKGSTVSYDFTTAASQAYGNNETEVTTGVFAIYSGDCNQDGYVDPLDLSMVDQDSYNYASGAALATDVNGDRYVDPLDLSIVDQNSYNYAGIQRPTTSKMISAKERAANLPYYQEWLKKKAVK
jgi:hypothetical protein